MPVVSGTIIVSHQSVKTSTPQQQPTGSTGAVGAVAPQQQSALMQIPSAFVRLRQQQQRQVFLPTINTCPRCRKPVVSPNSAVFCAGCGLPLYGCPCPLCNQVLEYSREHVKPGSEIFYCHFCGTQLQWRQRSGGPAHLEIY